jgi:hypothetical protein
MRTAILIGVLLSVFASGAMADSKSVCTKKDAMAFQDAVDHLSSWNAIYALYKRYGQCAEKSADESRSDAEEKLLTMHWEQTGTLQRLIVKDPGFEKFALWNIDSLWSLESDYILAENVQKHCRVNMQALCRKMWDSSEDERNGWPEGRGAHGSFLPPVLPSFDDVQAVPGASPFSGVTFGNLKIAFGQDSLRATLGTVKSGELASFYEKLKEDSICYYVRERGKSIRVWLASSPTSGNPDFVNGAYVAYEREARHSMPECPELPADLQPVRLDSKVWLGATQAQLTSTLGKSAVVWNDLHVYRTTVDDVVWTLAARVRSGKVVALYAFQTGVKH